MAAESAFPGPLSALRCWGARSEGADQGWGWRWVSRAADTSRRVGSKAPVWYALCYS
jgi:hypothetical protein